MTFIHSRIIKSQINYYLKDFNIMAIPTNKEIYDKAVRESSKIMTYEQIALNAMFELRQLLTKKRKRSET